MEVRGVVFKEGKLWIGKLYPRNGDHSVFRAEGKKQKDVVALCNVEIEEKGWTLAGSYQKV